MDINRTLLILEKRGYINRKPKAIYVFLLGFSYLLIWYFTFNFYVKYELKSLKIWILVLTLITIFTFIFAIFHLWVLLRIGNKPKIPKALDEE
ncbi:MAG: hypothetical protein QXW97_02480 [Candidatus Pacearchaeota archaeon]